MIVGRAGDNSASTGGVVKRRLSDSEARWEAVVLIDAAATAFVHDGSIVSRGEAEGWTDADVIAVERYVYARLDGLKRRPRRAPER